MQRPLWRGLTALGFCLFLARPGQAQQVQVESFTLDNGMEFLIVPRAEQPNSITAGWVAKVGSVNERPGITGLSHFFEHMMFKGTRTIGTNDAGADEAYRERQRSVKMALNQLVWSGQYKQYLLGNIDDPWDAANDTDEIRELRENLATLITDHADVIVSNEFDTIYTAQGGTGMNAFTANDLTFYFINVPSNKFELWAWMESDRLSNSVFREFYAERDVVHEERRLRVESTPTGIFQEQFDAMFWQASPYSWPVIGWPSDLNSYTLDQAREYYATYYCPNNLVGVIVGDFDPSEIKPVIHSYFSRLERGEDPPPVVTLEIEQIAEKRMYAECDCQPQIEIRYHGVPFGHADSYPLEIMAALLNGTTGRLYKSMIEGSEIAATAAAANNPLGAPSKYAGFFSFTAETKSGSEPEDLEAAWYTQLDRLQNEPVDAMELQKVKNQLAADAFRRLDSNFFLLLQIGYYEAVGGWEYINEAPPKLQAVTAADIQRVANTYFARTNQNVAIYRRKAGTEANVDPDLAGLDPQQRAGVENMLKQMEGRTLEELQLALGQLNQQAGTVPPEFKAMFEVMLKKLQERINALEAGDANDGGDS